MNASNSTPAPVDGVKKENDNLRRAVLIYPLIMLGGAVLAFFVPSVFVPLNAYINYGLMIVMFTMGLTLTFPDFALVAKRPLPVLLGVVFQYLTMPFLALGIALLFSLPPALAAGLILLGCVPGGTASNVVTYLARGDVALSVTMTSLTTLLAPLLTPALMLWLAGQFLPVPAAQMAQTIVTIVLIPVLAGLLLRLFLPRVVQLVQGVLPWTSMIFVSVIVMALVSNSREAIMSAGVVIFVCVVLHNVVGYAVGYAAARVARGTTPVKRAISIEIGTQNSGLAAGLAAQYITPEAALPSVIAAVWHNLSGGLLASYWGRKPVTDESTAPGLTAVGAEVSDGSSGPVRG